MEAAGVPVAEGELLVKGVNESPTIELPFIVKPCREGNSEGLSLVTEKSQIPAALEKAFEFDTQAVVEKFVPLGRELRVACIENEDGSLRMLPAVEYFIKNVRHKA